MDKLLETLIRDQKSVKNIYKPGKYWIKKSQIAIKELEKKGLTDFRSSNNENVAATAFADNTIIDSRKRIDKSSLKNRLGLSILNNTSLRHLFEHQVSITQNLFERVVDLEKNILLQQNFEKINYLLSKYKIENSVNFGCDRIITVDGKNYSTHYLKILEQIDHIENKRTLRNVRTYLEIGPGFGTTTHLIEQNFKNIKKFVLLDIVPNVWVVTKYLNEMYGNCVVDYLNTRHEKEIKFQNNSKLEIIVIPTWEIEKISESIDCFWNSHSFVEMSEEIIKNFARNILQLKNENSLFNFISYDNFDLSTTISPNKIPEYFSEIKFEKSISRTLFDESRENYFYLN